MGKVPSKPGCNWIFRLHLAYNDRVPSTARSRLADNDYFLKMYFLSAFAVLGSTAIVVKDSSNVEKIVSL